ncbi:type I restriction modification DNA specificity domain protein [Acinetobacter junii SH205]|uniref:Type I restriction modification DNA specificity domain protein n=1 Tax=Acinetobacter junii SH205 TaxID=575587 RepID=D0SKX4_ACIJU|nr:restriction endonuclease subunit S [Acinetobacter junii]EEY94496.1 type I restriction modification DNA specificity domain protein [Acinetobacter junii SH205]
MTDVKKLITEHLDIWLTAETEKKSGRGRKSGSSNSIYGVQKLRELILDLAVTGKLTNSLNSDTNADEILKKIADEKEVLINQGNLKKVKYSFPPKNNDFLLPSKWVKAYLGEVTLLITDGTHHTPKYLDSGIPFISVKDVSGKTISFDDCKYISSEEHSELIKRCKPEINDILLCRIGTLGRATLIDVEKDFSIFVSLGLLKLSKIINYSKYLHLFLHSPQALLQFDEVKVGGSHTNKLNLKDLPHIVINLPPLEEQQRIVEKVDELMQLCDQLEQQQNLSSEAHDQLVDTLLNVLTNSSDVDEFQQNWQRISENFDLLFTTEYSIDQLKQTILQLAVMGKLVKQDPNDEPASELLKQITEEKAKLIKEGKIKKSKPLLEISNEEKQYEIPHNWVWARLDSLTSKIGAGSTPKGGKEVYVDSGIPFLRSQNVWNDGLALDDVAFISEGTHEKMSGTHVQANDLLFNITGGSIGRCALVATDFETANVSQHVTIVRSIDKDLAPFLHLVLRSSYIQKLVMDVQVGVSREGLSIGKLSQFLIPLPSLTEQKRIIKKVEILNSIIDSLQVSLRKLQKTKLHLADSLIVNALLDSKDNNESQTTDNIIQFEKPIEIVKNSKQKSTDQIDLFADESVDDDLKLLSLAAEITFQLHTEPTFGHLKLQKLIYLCQQLKHMDLAADFKQHAAGPYDPVMARYLDKEFKDHEWFSYDPKRDLKYKPLSRCNDHRSAFNKYFAKDVSEIYDLIGLFRTSKSDHIEIVATLFACWLRLLEKKLSVTEEQLLKDFYAWSEEKKRFSKDEVLNGYKWMKVHSITPKL